jgi:hypothetical protein
MAKRPRRDHTAALKDKGSTGSNEGRPDVSGMSRSGEPLKIFWRLSERS